MELRALIREDDAISSVLGVVLMVAVTIVLAAVVGTFVLGIGQDLTDDSPSANFEYSVDVNDNATENSTVTILHSSGDPIESDELEVTVDGQSAWEAGDPRTGYTADGWRGEVAAGDRLELEDDGDEMESGDMLRIIWQGDDAASIVGEQELS